MSWSMSNHFEVYWSLRNPFVSAFHTSAEYVHSKKMCSRVSRGWWHMTQFELMLTFHFSILSPVDNRIEIQWDKCIFWYCVLEPHNISQPHSAWTSLKPTKCSLWINSKHISHLVASRDQCLHLKTSFDFWVKTRDWSSSSWSYLMRNGFLFSERSIQVTRVTCIIYNSNSQERNH